MTDTTDLIQAIARLRRAMPRNEDVLAVCDAAERAIVNAANAVSNVSNLVNKPKVNRNDYMRDYMKRRRAASRKVGSIQ